MFVEAEALLGTSNKLIALPASAINYAPYGDSVFVVADDEGPEREHLSRRPAAVREARPLARRPGRRRLGPQGRAGGRDLGRLQAPQRRRRPGEQQGPAGERPGARSPRTADEVHRPLHPAAGPRDRRQPRHLHRRAAVDPLPLREAVSAQRHRGRQGHDRLRRRERRPRARLHHDAPRARDRERGRHRLPGVLERAGRQHDHRAPEAELRHERRPHADPGEGRPGQERPPARSRRRP